MSTATLRPMRYATARRGLLASALLALTACQSENPAAADGAVSPDGASSSPADLSTAPGADLTSPKADLSSPPGTRFSFFVTSLKALQDLSGNQLGFGGDLRYGETGAGAGLRGADKLCAAIAERSLPGAGKKPWRAFLSATADENGKQVDAIDRVGDGPWYDRLGRLLAANKADLAHDRPVGADPAIKNDFPNEDGVPNHRPDLNQPIVDNHDMLTGSGATGRLYQGKSTCLDWTANAGNKPLEGQPRVGHSWPRQGSGVNWMSALTESGCAPGVNLVEMGGPMPNSNTVGSGGGYGGFYCFSLVP